MDGIKKEQNKLVSVVSLMDFTEIELISQGTLKDDIENNLLKPLFIQLQSIKETDTLLITFTICRKTKDINLTYTSYIVLRKESNDSNRFILLDSSDIIPYVKPWQATTIFNLSSYLNKYKEPDRFLKAITIEYLPIDSFIAEQFNNEK